MSRKSPLRRLRTTAPSRPGTRTTAPSRTRLRCSTSGNPRVRCFRRCGCGLRDRCPARRARQSRSNVLSVASALGLAVVIFQVLGGEPGLTFYVPFVAAVLLLALGADYYVFAVGAIWTEAARHPLRRAVALAVPATTRAISAAGTILSATFGMVAIIPLGAFRQLAFIMAVGLLLDTFLVRPVLTPAVLTLLGPAASWPSRRIRTADPIRRGAAGRPRRAGEVST